MRGNRNWLLYDIRPHREMKQCKNAPKGTMHSRANNMNSSYCRIILPEQRCRGLFSYALREYTVLDQAEQYLIPPVRVQ